MYIHYNTDAGNCLFDSRGVFYRIFLFVTIHSLSGCDSNGFCQRKSPAAMGKTPLSCSVLGRNRTASVRFDCEPDDLEEDKDSEKAFAAIRNLEFVRYHVFPKGYMVRVSARSNQEQIRISRNALENGISFAKVGALYIRKYKEVSGVKNVRVIFITEKELVEKLLPNADKVDTITKTLTHILDGMPTDCGHCSMKPVCDEVDGMKELHLGKRKQ